MFLVWLFSCYNCTEHRNNTENETRSLEGRGCLQEGADLGNPHDSTTGQGFIWFYS